MTGYKNENGAQRLYRLFYSTALTLALPLLLLVLRKKLHLAQDYDGNTRRFSERFGKVPSHFKTKGVLIHCVSMGELNASVQLVKHIQKRHPRLPITVTTTSTTGAVHAYNLFKETVQHMFLPIDLPFFMHRFFQQLQPKLVLVTEVEIWPNMLHQCVKQQTPVCLINARLSDTSLPSYRKLRFLLRPALRKFDLICAQSQSAYNNFTKMGVYKHQLLLTLNMKFDMQAEPEDEHKARLLSQRYQLAEKWVWVAASTHKPEEIFVLSIYEKLLQIQSNLSLIIVPRHPHRFDEVYLMIKATGLSVARLSDKQSLQAQVILVDQMGWLKACYSVCTAAFIGGSIATKGGHNALECAMYAKPMVMGPSIFNNPGIVEMLATQHALELVEDQSQCIQALQRLMQNKCERERRGEAGQQVLVNNRGAVSLTYQHIEKFL
jgi:3-deoxy-D-manno-octulosonic-acid transferase